MRLYYGDRALAGLRAVGDVILNSKSSSLEGEALIEAARDCDLIVSYRQSPGPAKLFESLPKLKAFVRCAIDIRNVDVPAASKAGVLVTQASAGFVTSVSEIVFGFMIDLARGVIPATHLYHHSRVPPAKTGRELRGSTIGVIGYGQIGKEVVRLAEAFGMKVLVNDPYVSNVKTVPLEKLLAESDFVVPLAVATEETENLINASALTKMKKGSFLINVSRGNLVDEAAVEAALKSGHLAGCAMDVGRAPDQMPMLPLASRPDVIATPHIAGLTVPAIEHQSMETVAQAAEIAKGRAPKGAVNSEHWRRKP